MRVAVVTDIHGNRRAFQAVLEDLRQVAPDLVVHGGDLVFGGTHPREIIDEIRTLGWPGVLGNTDEMLWTQERPIEMASAHPHLASLLGRLQDMVAPMRARIGDERLRWLRSLPTEQAGEGFAVVHARPKDLCRPQWPTPPMKKSKRRTWSWAFPWWSTDTFMFLMLGGARNDGGKRGSVSQSYDGDRCAAYAVIEGEKVTIRRVEYDVESEAKELLHSGVPHAEWLSRILLAGQYCRPG